MAEKKFNLFGFRIKKKDEDLMEPSFTPPSNEDGAYTVATADAQFGSAALDLDGSVKSEVELITRYREMAMQPEIETAIEDIVNEAIVKNDDGKSIEIITDQLKQPDKLKNAIAEEFANILRLLNYDNMAHDIFRRYYIDGRINYHIMIDIDNPKKGIKELRYIDPRKIRKVREVKKQKNNTTGVDIIVGHEEYYVYAEKITSNPNSSGNAITGIKISPDSIIQVNSGLVDPKKGVVLSYLHKAIRPLNQLRMIEDASLIYKICLAGNTRIRTNTGWKYIKDVTENDIVYSFYGHDGVKETVVNKQWKTATKQTYKVSSKYFNITGTNNHPILVLDKTTNIVEYIDIENIIPNRHCFVCPSAKSTLNTLLTFTESTGTYKDIDRIPENVFNSFDNDKLSLILHLVKEYGNISYNELSDVWTANISIDNPLLIEDIKELWTQLGYISSEVSYDNNWSITLSNKILPKFDPILFVEEDIVQDVYDVEVASEKHNFIANGIVVHNSRAPQRRIFYVDVGNLPKIKAEQYVRDMMVKYKNKVVYDACLAMDTLIPLIDGRTLSLYQIQKEFEQGKELWAYSCDPVTGKFAPGLISSAGVTKFNQEVMRITLDNGKSITCTLDHKFPVWNKGKVEAKDLLEGDSMIPFHVKDQSSHELIFQNDKKEWKFTQELVSEWRNSVGLTNSETNIELHVQEPLDTVSYHKVAKIEFLSERMDVGTLGIDKEEKYHNYHTFALDSGIYTCNSTGQIRDDRKHLSILEDFWMPRRNDGKTTEITTLDSSDSFNDMSMVEYFERKLYKSLNVPVTRLDPSQAVSIGRSMEITRDELKFSKFIDKLRNKFSELFDQALRVQLILKGVCTADEWEEFKEYITYDFIKDNNFVELKEAEIMQERLGILAIIDQYSQKYYSKKWIQQNVLRLNDQEIAEMTKEIEEEKNEDFEQQSIDQTRQIQLQAQSAQLQNQLMPSSQEQAVEAGDQPEEPEQQDAEQEKRKPKHPYDIPRIPN